MTHDEIAPPDEPSVLVVDDDNAVRDSLRRWLAMDGYRVEAAPEATTALQMLERQPFDVALVDIKMPGMDGVALQHRIAELGLATRVVIVTAFASVDTAVDVLKHGAFDYLTKPVDPEKLSEVVRRAASAAEEIMQRVPGEGATGGGPEDYILGRSAAMERVRRAVHRAAVGEVREAPVLVLGERGTGRRLVAETIHCLSVRRFFAMVPVNCDILDEDSARNTLLGRAPGVGSHPSSAPQRGCLSLARGGTLYLCEISKLPSSAQMQLVEALRRNRSPALGAHPTGAADFRLISSSEVPLEPLVRADRFRDELLCEVNALQIRLPPLRERPEDIPALAEHALRRASQRVGHSSAIDGGSERRISEEAMSRLVAANWAGNVRELFNVIERAYASASGSTLQPGDLPLEGQ